MMMYIICAILVLTNADININNINIIGDDALLSKISNLVGFFPINNEEKLQIDYINQDGKIRKISINDYINENMFSFFDNCPCIDIGEKFKEIKNEYVNIRKDALVKKFFSYGDENYKLSILASYLSNIYNCHIYDLTQINVISILANGNPKYYTLNGYYTCKIDTQKKECYNIDKDNENDYYDYIIINTYNNYNKFMYINKI